MQYAKTRRLVFAAMFAAMSIVLYFFEFPLIPGLPYLKVDLSDLPAVIAAVFLGLPAGVAIELIKNVVHVVIRGFGDTMGFGDLINFLVGSALTVSFAGVFRPMVSGRLFKGRLATPAKAIAPALVAAVAGMTAAGVVFNYLIAPPYFHFFLHISLGGAALWGAIGGASILNVVKAVLVSLLSLPLIMVGRRYLKV